MLNLPPHHTPAKDSQRIRDCFLIVLSFTALLWMIKVVEFLSGSNYIELGIFPGVARGMPGIFLAPLIHGSFSHLLANTLPLLILGTALLYGYPRSARLAIPVIYLGTGLCVWLFGREAWHIGASGLTFGFMFFVFSIGVMRWDRKAIALSMMVFFLYGGMLVGLLPGKPEISFESHLSGAIIGLILAIVLRNTDPRPPQKQYDWENEPDEAIDPYQE